MSYNDEPASDKKPAKSKGPKVYQRILELCEAEGIKIGAHNVPVPTEQQKIQVGNAAQIALAAKAAEQARKATEAIKAGQKVSLS